MSKATLENLEMNLPDLENLDHESLDDDRLPQLYARLHRVKKQLKEKRKEVSSIMSEMEQRILDYFTEMGYQNIKTQDGTVHLWSTIRASKQGGVDWEQACTAVKRAGWEELVEDRFHSGSLASVIRERIESEYDGDVEAFMEDMPDEFRESINVYEDFKAKVRSS